MMKVLPQDKADVVVFPPPVVENETQRILRAALRRLGPNGEFWFQGNCSHGDNVCAVTALGIAITGEVKCGRDSLGYCAGRESPFYYYLATAAGGFVPNLNDAPTTTFADIRAMFEKAIQLAGEAA